MPDEYDAPVSGDVVADLDEIVDEIGNSRRGTLDAGTRTVARTAVGDYRSVFLKLGGDPLPVLGGGKHAGLKQIDRGIWLIALQNPVRQ